MRLEFFCNQYNFKIRLSKKLVSKVRILIFKHKLEGVPPGYRRGLSQNLSLIFLIETILIPMFTW